MKAKLLFILLLIGSFLGAIELPIYALWQARHYLYYDTLQSGKELSWDELYRAELGISNAEWKDIELSFAVETEEFFNEAFIRLKSFNLRYQLPHRALYLGSETELKGYGKSYSMDSLPILERGYNSYRFQPMRMNALMLGWQNEKSYWELLLGGNKHNQASLALVYAGCLHSEAQGKYQISLDARAMDNHWRTPVLIPALKYEDTWQALNWEMEAALAILPQWEATDRQEEYFALAELQYKPACFPEIGAAACFKQMSFAPHEEREYRLYLAQDCGSFRFLPIASRQELDHVYLNKYILLSQYKLLGNSTIGAYYEYSHFGKNKPHHTLGLALDLEFAPVY